MFRPISKDHGVVCLIGVSTSHKTRLLVTVYDSFNNPPILTYLV